MPRKKKFEYSEPSELTSEVISIFKAHVKAMEPVVDCPIEESFFIEKGDPPYDLNIRLLRDFAKTVEDKVVAVIDWGENFEVCCLPVGIDVEMFYTYVNMPEKPKTVDKPKEVKEFGPTEDKTVVEESANDVTYYDSSQDEIDEVEDDSFEEEVIEDYADISDNVFERLPSYLGTLSEMQKYDPEMTNEMYCNAVVTLSFLQRRFRGISIIKKTSDPKATLKNVIAYLTTVGRFVKIPKAAAEKSYGRPVSMYKIVL